ncbi:MAG TPA: hypothetical protein VIU44_08100 [Gaiellaceae bacterium]
MTISVTPTESNALAALRTFLVGNPATFAPGALPAGVEAVLGQVNRVASPKGPDYAVYWPLRRRRLGTNLDSFADAKFTGTIAGATMTITDVIRGALKVGSALFGVDLPGGLAVQAFGTGGGGLGTYTVAPALVTPFGPGTISAGVKNIEQQTEFTVQIDVHGPNSGDNAQRISTLLRDDFGVEAFAASGFDVTPLHADEPRQIPFLNDQNQYENRWVIEACLQVNDVVQDIPQQFADSAVVGLKDVDAFYPP